ncbi:MAG TPA: Rieske 2Fe-2S domain-containing protein [Chloroflexota bacterium]|nr:Rieske 2Fe-2S domain-containing protein [Chloroflexota bacterium]
MLSKEANELLTRVGPGTVMGDLMRQYWMPFLYSWEIEPDGAPLRVRLLGEDLIAWRDTDGRVGLINQYCPHRGASFFFGRNEERGIRCVYHGWKFDVDGNCTDMPNEPPESNFKHKVKATTYRCVDRGGVVFAYMGPLQDNPPGLPQFEWMTVPAVQRHHEYKAVLECNWVQALEGDIDTAHLYFLHSRLDPSQNPATGVYHPDRSPRLEITEQEYGLLYGARRVEGPDRIYWRTTQFLMPIYTMFPASEDGIVPSHIYTPIDDEHTLHWGVRWHPVRELPERELMSNKAEIAGMGHMREEQHGKFFAHWWPAARQDNDFLLDRDVQRSQTYTGIPTIRLQDAAVITSMGPIQDRTTERLGTTDAMIIKVRQRLMRAATALREHGMAPPGVDRPEAYRVRSGSVVLADGLDWKAAMAAWHEGRDTEPPSVTVARAGGSV